MKNAIRTKQCSWCGQLLSYSVGRGKDRIYCSKKCGWESFKKNRRDNLNKLPRCKVENCNKPATRTGTCLCELHYYRLRRTGTTQPRIPRGWFMHGGYVKLVCPTHPLADSNGTVMEHRAVAYKEHGGVCPPCFWCGKKLRWDRSTHVDHLDGIKDNNTPDNLAVSCSACNRMRGYTLSFLKRLGRGKLGMILAMLHNPKSS